MTIYEGMAISMASVALLLSCIATVWLSITDRPHNAIEHLQPDAVIAARQAMRDDLQNYLEERANAIQLDLKRDIQTIMYKEIADYRAWIAKGLPD